MIARQVYLRGDNHPKAKAELKCARCLYACGFGVKRIADRIFKTKSTVSKHLRRHSICIRPDSVSRKIGLKFAPRKPKEYHYSESLMRGDFIREWKGVESVDCKHWARHPDAPTKGMINYHKNILESRKRSAQSAKHQWEKNKHDDCYRLKKLVATHIYKALNLKTGQRKPERTVELIGCTLEQFKQHIESQFTQGMTWDNRGEDGWELDHIIPKSTFNLKDPKQRRQCFHYSNYQPLWRADNRRKHAKVLKTMEMFTGVKGFAMPCV